MNGFFKTDEPTVKSLAGYDLPEDWWSRPWEYYWALQQASAKYVVADMGCGWMYRPFKDALANTCHFVFAVDRDKRLLNLQRAENMAFVIADIIKEITPIDAGSIDRLFCISVLEDLGDMVWPALQEFARCLAPAGLAVITFDVPFADAPTPVYPGLPLAKFEEAVSEAGLQFVGEIDYSKDKAVNHKEWNLCVFHCLLEKTNGAY